MSIYPTKGERLTYEVESSFGTDPDVDPKDIRMEGSPTIAEPFQSSIQPATVYSNVHDSDKPLLINESIDDAVKVTVGLRQADSGESFLTTALKSGGFKEEIGSADTTLTGVPTVDALILAANESGIGMGAFVEVDSSGLYWPILAAAYNIPSTTITPAMDMISAPSTGDNVLKASTLSPGSPKEVATTLSLNHITRAQEGATFVKAQALGCALQSVGSLVIEMNTAPTLELSFRAAKLTTDDTLVSMYYNDFNDVEARIPINCSSAWEYADSAMAGGITRSLLTVYKGTFTFGWSTQAVPGFGDTSACVNGIQAHIVTPEDGEKRYVLELEVPFDYQFVDDWEGDNPEKHIAFMQPSADTSNLGFGLVMPKCTLMEKPAWSKENPEHRMTLKYNCAPAGYDLDATDDSDGGQPYYLILPTA